ncbi:MAG TPA: DUF2723 domain-containing protein [Flavipsychrobacter sp.]|nr:DUF2723 domain-containing protein [Flavipsychrobacter sp.]
MNYRKVNNIVGWVVFAIATAVYFMTMEPTVSFWDCGEFLSCGYKLEVGHSPGAPFFMLIQRMFGMLAGGDLTKVAMMINAWSALASSLTILFLFWTITHFAKRLVLTNYTDEPNGNQLVMIMGAGAVGALAYTFSDTFWFSAVEAEVYATSSLFTAFVFWAILKWEHIADNKYADRWLILIFFVLGLTIATHLLSLLAIPTMALVYYFKRYNPSRMGALIAFLVGCVILGIVQIGVVQGLPWFAFKFDLFFVNSMGMPFDTGALVFLVLFVALLVGVLFYARKKNNYLLHTGTLGMIFVLIGYSSYLVPLLRSRADVPIDMTNPDAANTFLSYVNREQFGSQPLLFGPDYDTPPVDVVSKGKWYEKSTKNGKDVYEEVGEKVEYKYESKRFFPRMWDASKANAYRQRLGLSEGESPTSADNFRFFFDYQINWMWWRYFMWNFAGRQNDFEGQGGPKEGNWISGIAFLDKMKVGDVDQMADGYNNNRAMNKLYFLPFILGVLGLVYQFNRDKRNGFIVFSLFFFTGIAVQLYINNTPLQPRERDYQYISAYVFAIWIGIGMLMVNEWFQKAIKGSTGIYASLLLCLAAAPVLMASQEWDDHDRSRKTLARATAVNTLESCAPNAILFTYGDNDTYPLWYAQEVEGIRKDIRIINTSLLGIGWYIDQLNYRINDGDAVPMIWKKDDYVGDRRNYVRYFDNPQIPKDRYFNLEEICNFILSKDQANQLRTNTGEMTNYLPSKNFMLPSLTRSQLVAAGLLSANDSSAIDTNIRFTLPTDAAMKDDLAIMNIVAAVAKEGWKRPIYFGSGGESYAGMNDYLKLEGTVYRLVPYKQQNLRQNSPGEYGFVDINKSYELFKKYTYGGAERKDVYFDEKNRLALIPYRSTVARVADELSARGRKAEALEILNKVMTGISNESYAHDFASYGMVAAYYRAGDLKKGRELAMKLAKSSEDDIKYIANLNSEGARESMVMDIKRDLYIINISGNFAMQAGDSTTAKEMNDKLQALNKVVIDRIGEEVFRP